MIFESVNQISRKDEFLEKIQIYERLVEVFAERLNLTIDTIKDSNSDIVDELSNIGVITRADDVSTLRSILNKDYSHFISCVAFYLTHKKEMGSTLDKLSNKKRHELQEKEHPRRGAAGQEGSAARRLQRPSGQNDPRRYQ